MTRRFSLVQRIVTDSWLFVGSAIILFQQLWKMYNRTHRLVPRSDTVPWFLGRKRVVQLFLPWLLTHGSSEGRSWNHEVAINTMQRYPFGILTNQKRPAEKSETRFAGHIASYDDMGYRKKRVRCRRWRSRYIGIRSGGSCLLNRNE